MKSKSVIALISLWIVSGLVISPAAAKNVIYKANGTLDAYINPTSAEVYVGTWQIRITDNEVIFKGHYKELNIAEETPGTLDDFKLTLIDAGDPIFDDGECKVSGTLVLHKRGWDPFGENLPGYIDLPGQRYYAEIPIAVDISIDSEEIIIDFIDPEFGGIKGATLSMH